MAAEPGWDVSAVADSLRAVRERIARACDAAGRDPGEVALVAVSKTKSADDVRAAYDAGQRLFGENYVQELEEKAQALRSCEGLRWHFIGHLQRNKAKDVVPIVSCIETVDSARLADAIAKRVEGGGRIEVMLQVNVAREPQKSGCLPEELGALVTHVRGLEGLTLRGLMTVPPALDDPRPHFRALRALATEHALRDLSMGMSADLEAAIAEGATIVRVGTAIFGSR